jgi:protein SCO1
MKKYRPFIVLFILLILPLLVYVYLKVWTKQNYRPVEIISEKIPNPDGSLDSVFIPVGDFAFTGQSGKLITQDSLKGKIWVANLFHSNCAKACDVMNDYVRQMLEKDFPDEPDVRFLSFSVDPANDSVPMLKVYADRTGAVANRWYFLTGHPDSLKKFIVEELHYPEADPKVIAENKLHDTSFRLVDWNGLFRGDYYDGTNETDMVTMAQHIVMMLRERADSSANAGNKHP